MKKIMTIAAALLMAGSAFAQQALWGGASVESPVVNEDGTVTFRYQAPKAVKVTVSGDFLPTQKMTFKMGDQEMTFDAPGVGELKEGEAVLGLHARLVAIGGEHLISPPAIQDG